MPRSILTIDVDDARFKAYLELYKKYESQLAEMKGAWTGAGEATAEAGAATSEMTDALAAGAASAALIVTAIEKAGGAAERTAAATKSMADHAKSFSGSLASGAGSLATFLTGAIGATIATGTAALYAVDRLSKTVSGQLFAAQGLGISVGQMQAFDTNFGTRLVGSDFLSNVQGVRSDLTQQWQFSQLGIPESEVKTADDATLSIDVIKKAQELWHEAGPGGHNQQWMAAHGLTGFLGSGEAGFEAWQRIGRYHNGQDVAGYEAQYGKDVPTMGGTDKQMKDWQDLAVQFKRTGDQIEASFTRGLSPLLPVMTKLAQAAGDTAVAVQHIAEMLDKAFQPGAAGSPGAPGSGPQNPGLTPPGETPPSEGGWGLDPSTGRWSYPRGTNDNASAANPAPAPLHYPAPTNPNEYGKLFAGIEKADNLPPGLLRALGIQESGLTAHPPDSVVRGAHYQGMFQLGPGVQHDYLVSDPYDAEQSANATGNEIRDLIAHYHGNVAEALAAHNWGPGDVDRDVAAHGRDWLSKAPRETQDLVAAVAARLNIQVSVLNQTGADVAILANAVRQ